MVKHYRPPGKKWEGNAAKYVTRSQALKLLQISVPLFRYPRFVDALGELDDCLKIMHLFATLPALESKKIDVESVHRCRRLAHEWQAFISRTHKFRKTFVSMKGIYYQAQVEGQTITWITPHLSQQVVPDTVDITTMLNFSQFYEICIHCLDMLIPVLDHL